MEISRQQWHTRAYLWWYGHKYGKQRRDVYTGKLASNLPTHSNLCPYMRAVMFWAPLRFLFWNWVVLGRVKSRFKITVNMLTIPSILVALPFVLKLFSAKAAVFMLVLYYAFSTSIVLVVALYYSVEWLKARARQRANSSNYILEEEERLRRWEARRARMAKFNRLITEYFRAGHDRVCPELSIVDEQEDKQS